MYNHILTFWPFPMSKGHKGQVLRQFWICEGHRCLFLILVSKEAKNTEKFHYKKKGHRHTISIFIFFVYDTIVFPIFVHSKVNFV